MALKPYNQDSILDGIVEPICVSLPDGSFYCSSLFEAYLGALSDGYLSSLESAFVYIFVLIFGFIAVRSVMIKW